MAISGLAVTVFTVDGQSILGTLQSADFEITNETEDTSGVADRWGEPIVVGSDWRIEGEMQFTASATLAALAAGNDVAVAVSFNTGGNLYEGNAILARAGHRVGKRAVQTQTVTLMGTGAPTVTAPA